MYGHVACGVDVLYVGTLQVALTRCVCQHVATGVEFVCMGTLLVALTCVLARC